MTVELLEQSNNIDTQLEELLEKNGSFVWVTRGSSMRPLLKTGRDLVQITRLDIACPDCRLKIGDVALYRIPDEVCGNYSRIKTPYVLHRVIDIRDDCYVIRGDNNPGVEFVPFDWVIGVMTGVTRKGRDLDLNGKKYRFYVKHWVGRYKLRMRLKKMRFGIRKAVYPIYKKFK